MYGWGFSGVQGDSPLDSGAGVFARAIGDAGNTVQPVGLLAEADAPATVAIQATGEVRVTGDLFVDGTIHTNNPIDLGWTRGLRRSASVLPGQRSRLAPRSKASQGVVPVTL